MVVRRFDVYLVALDAAQGHEMKKTRPCVVISPDEMNRHLQTVVIAPLTSSGRQFPFRVPCRFSAREGQISIDQLRCVDVTRLVKRVGTLGAATAIPLRETLMKMFG